VAAYLKASGLRVFPSHREGVPNAVIEAMACGIQVVITPFVGLSPDLGVPERGCLMSGHNSQTLASGIIRTVKDREFNMSLRLHGRKWVEETLDVEKGLERYIRLYRDLVERSRSPAGEKGLLGGGRGDGEAFWYTDPVK
jgi:glycosyltransferase involved in cell wall biosynthesis